MNAVLSAHAFILHTRPYRETSLIVEFMTDTHGRIAAIAKGAKGKKNALAPVLQPFIPLWISWSGKKDLVTLRTAEISDKTFRFPPKKLIYGFYLNELIMRIVPHGAPCEKIFALYQEALKNLASAHPSEEITLRKFERRLLEDLGIAISFTHDIHQKPILDTHSYCLIPEKGGLQLQEKPECGPSDFSGKNIWAIGQERYESPAILQEAKRFFKIALRTAIGIKPIKTRELWIKKQ